MDRRRNQGGDAKGTIWSRAHGVLRNAFTHGSASVVGNKAKTVGLSWPQTTQDRGQFLGVVPRVADRRVISLECDADMASGISLVFSYNAGVPAEASPGLTVREFAAVLEWGTGNGRHVIEIDIAEGTRVSLHTQTVDVSIVDYSLTPGPGTDYWDVENAASVAYLPGSKPAVKTQRVYLPLRPVGLGGGGFLPIEELMDRLVEAIEINAATAGGTTP